MKTPRSVRTEPATSIRSHVPLPEWLDYLVQIHPRSISMGLARINKVKQALRLHPRFPIITVGGTNGKGSTCAMLEAILTEAGYRAGCYTSPHLLHYNERVRIDRAPLDDLEHVQAFARVESARGSIPLTYFEFSTLAAMEIFVKAQVDVAVMEVGMGGRLDAVNLFDADCALVTSVAMDHMEYLGNTREQIGFEKAGIFRAGRPAVCAEPEVPKLLAQHAREIGAQFLRIGKEFTFTSRIGAWEYRGDACRLPDLPYPSLRGAYQLQNASAAITALLKLGDKLPVEADHIRKGLLQAVLPGRFQIAQENPTIIFDVAHNPHAAEALAKNLGAMDRYEKTIAVFAMLKDKDIAEVVRVIKHRIDVWLVADILNERGATAQLLKQELEKAGVAAEQIISFSTPADAYLRAVASASEYDRIIVFGSFHTVTEVLRLRQK